MRGKPYVKGATLCLLLNVIVAVLALTLINAPMCSGPEHSHNHATTAPIHEPYCPTHPAHQSSEPDNALIGTPHTDHAAPIERRAFEPDTYGSDPQHGLTVQKAFASGRARLTSLCISQT
ncbi:MAG: hypothetical protein HOQ05_03385 [Corynebacteriales bacterium]|nr:hypothetical protein [Mycobacteriales bacterium]